MYSLEMNSAGLIFTIQWSLSDQAITFIKAFITDKDTHGCLQSYTDLSTRDEYIVAARWKHRIYKTATFQEMKKKKHWIFLINHFVKVDIVALWSDIINILPKSDLNGATRFLNSKFQKNLEYIRVLSVIGKAAYEVVNALHYVFINL